MGFVHRSRTIFCRAVPTLISRFATFASLYDTTLFVTNTDDLEWKFDQGFERGGRAVRAGLQLDYSDALIGGGFQFANPNSTEECGCGKSFSA